MKKISRSTFFKQSIGIGGAIYLMPILGYSGSQKNRSGSVSDLWERMVSANDRHVKALIVLGDEANRHGGRSYGYNFAMQLYPDPKYVQRIDEWLSEGIYLDGDGHYPERSMNYSDVENSAFITLGRLLNRPELYEAPRKSLQMTYYYMEPNGDLVTTDSRRQDQYSHRSIVVQYLHYRFLAIHDSNGEFASIAKQIEGFPGFANTVIEESLFHFMEDETLHRPLPNLEPLPTDFEKLFRTSSLARNRPLDNTVWLDDLFMSVPALAQMGAKTGDSNYFDEAVRQVLAFSKRMYNWDKKIYMHGWVEGSNNFPQFHWARANGWAFMTLVELLDVLPEDHAGRGEVMGCFLSLAEGLASYQSDTGLWHQLLDRNDSYLETSATAIYTYGFARAINKGWLDYRVFGPLTLLAWSGVSTQVNDKGQVEGTSVGTGMGFDPAFYYHRPISVYAAHGYGPVLLAGAEVIKLLQNHSYEIKETAVQFVN